MSASVRGGADSPELDGVKGLVFAFAGVVMLVIAVALALDERAFLARSVVAPGVVVREEAGPAHVVVRFRSRDGRDRSYSQNGEIVQHAGDHVRVRYDPSDPQARPSLDTFGAEWGGTIALGVLGVAFTTIGVSLLVGAWRRMRSRM